MRRLVLYTLDLIFIVAISGPNRTRPDSPVQERDMSFLEKSYHMLWHRLRSTLSKKNIEHWLAKPVKGILGEKKTLATEYHSAFELKEHRDAIPRYTYTSTLMMVA